MQQMLLQLWEAEKNTIVFVTHDINEALLLADRIVVFSARPGRIVEDRPVPFPFERPPEIVHTAEFMQQAEELRRLLQKPRPEALPPPPHVGLTAGFVARLSQLFVRPSSGPAAVEETDGPGKPAGGPHDEPS